MRFPLIDGFDHYAVMTGAAGSIDSAWQAVSGTPLAFRTGLGGENQSIEWASGVAMAYMVFPIPNATKISGHFAIKWISRPTGSQADYFGFQTAGGNRQFGFQTDTAGHILLMGEGGGIVATGEIPLLINQVYRISFTADMDTGAFTLKVNGELDSGLNGTYDIVDDAGTNTIGLVRNGQAADGFGGRFLGYQLDDVIIGIDQCVNWGPLEINTLPATADIVAEFTRSTGATNFSNVDELPFNADTDYNSSNTLNQKDIFDFGNPPRTPDSILCVQLMTLARKEESAVRKIREILRVNGVDYPGDEHNLAETYGRHVSHWSVNPATGNPWTATELNAIQGGYQLSQVD